METIRYQWMRNKEAGQTFGNQLEIKPLTEAVFQKHVKPLISRGAGGTLKQYQSNFPMVTHYGMVRVEGKSPWKFDSVGPIMSWMMNPNISQYGLRVKSWSDPKAKKWGRTADSSVYPLER